jgi:hypothetical protein
MRALLVCSLSLCCGVAFADDRSDIALARAEACIAIAKVTSSKPCVSTECKLAEIKADAAIRAAKIAPPCKCPPEACEGCDCPGPNCPGPATKAKTVPTPPAVLSPDGQTLNSGGKVYRRLPNGTFAEAALAPAKCVNGQCPNPR